MTGMGLLALTLAGLVRGSFAGKQCTALGAPL